MSWILNMEQLRRFDYGDWVFGVNKHGKLYGGQVIDLGLSVVVIKLRRGQRKKIMIKSVRFVEQLSLFAAMNITY